MIHKLTNGREAFDFEIYFSEVFHAKKGFDVIIANPPYVSVEKFARTTLQTEWKRKFRTYASRGDIYCFFYEQGLTLLHEGGMLRAGGRIEYRAANVKRLPIPSASASDKSRLTKLADRAANLAAAGGRAALAKVEQEIDEIVFRLFELTPDEIAQIETSLANTRGASSHDDNRRRRVIPTADSRRELAC